MGLMSLRFRFRKQYGFDELRSRSRICLELMICTEEIEMEESPVEK